MIANTINYRRESRYFIFFLFLSCIFLYFFSYSTTPLLPDFFGWDSAVFQLMGKCWVNGAIPYRDLFDHKGPIMPLINYMGYYISIGKWGLFTIQAILLSISMWSFYLVARLFVSTNHSTMIVLITMLILKTSFNEGNMTEEYSFPMLGFSLFFLTKYFLESNIPGASKKHSWKWSVVYGASFMGIAFLRITNALQICCLIFLVVCVLIWHKEWINILQNAAAFLLGMFLVFIPFAIYFYMHDALWDMIYCTFIFNFKYAVGGFFSSKRTLSVYVAVLEKLTPIFITLLASIWCFLRKTRLLAVATIFSSCAVGVMLLNGASYDHYFMLAIPFVPLSLSMFVKLLSINNSFRIYEKVLSWFIAIGLMFMCILGIESGLDTARWVMDNHKNQTFADYNEQALELSSKIPVIERDAVITYNFSNSGTRFLILTDLTPCYKYYSMQEFQSTFDPKIMTDFVSFLLTGRARWFVTEDETIENEEMQAVLEKWYTPYDSVFVEKEGITISLYKIKDGVI